MTQELIPTHDVRSVPQDVRKVKAQVIEKALVEGDLSKLTPQERIQHYLNVCNSLGLNPHTKPFGYISLNGKLVLYALRECTEQLRKVNGVSIKELRGEAIEGLYIVTASAQDKTGRVDSSTGAVPLEGLKGEAKANAIMKAETKAKRRVTLSICGLGMLDESEAPSVAGARVVDAEQAHSQHELASSLVPVNEQQESKAEPAGEWRPEFKLSDQEKLRASLDSWKKESRQSKRDPGKFYTWVFVPADWESYVPKETPANPENEPIPF